MDVTKKEIGAREMTNGKRETGNGKLRRRTGNGNGKIINRNKTENV